MPSFQKTKAQRQHAKAQRKPQRLEALTDEQLQQVVGSLGSSANLPVITNDLAIQSFVTGDINRPVVNGTNWNGQDHP